MIRIVRWSVFAAWIVLVTMLVRGRGDGPPPRAEQILAGPSRAVPSHEEWMGMYHGARKIGYLHLSVFGGDRGYSVEEESFLRMTILDTPQTVRMRVRAEAGEDHSLRKLDFRLDSGSGRLRVEGERSGDELRLRTTVGDDGSDVHVDADGPIFLAASVRRLVAATGLDPGRRYEVQVFDPSALRAQPIVATVVREEEVPDSGGAVGWRVEEEYAGVRSVAWIDAEGRVLREEGPMGLVLVRESRETATTANWSDGEALDLIAEVSIPVEPPLPPPVGLRELEVRVSGVEIDRVPADDRQSLRGDLLSVRRERVPAAAGYRLPYAGADLSADVAATPLLQTEHPRVRSVAAEALAGEGDPIEATRRLSRFVFARLRKVPTVSVPNALQVLDLGEGDCNEHAVLFAALARAVGLPARVVAGVVYANGAFQYHAWNEVWLGRWTSVDPVFDQFPADVTHVKFVSGGPEDHVAMVAVIGRLNLEVVASR